MTGSIRSGISRFNARYPVAAWIVFAPLIALAYFGLAKLGLALASINASATPIWPATGFAIAALLVGGYRLAPAIFAGAVAANYLTAGSIQTCVAIGFGNTLEALIAAALINAGNGREIFQTPLGIIRFGLICLVPATMASATVGVAALNYDGLLDPAKVIGIWTTWWLGDTAGALVVAPFLVLWANAPPPSFRLPSAGEFFVILLAAVGVALITFGPWLDDRINRNALGFIIVVPLLWAALRTSPRETATAALLISGIAVWGTYSGYGPFVSANVNASFLFLLMFMLSVTMPSLVLAADVAQRRETEHALRDTALALDRQIASGMAELAQKEQQFRLLIQSVSDYAIYMLDPHGNVQSWNSGAEKIHGYAASEIIGQNFERFYTAEDRTAGKPKAALGEARDKGIFQSEARRCRKDGSFFWANVIIRPIYGSDGTLIGYAKVTRDDTERKLAEEQLAQSRNQLMQAQKMEAVGQLTGGIAHDFNNLLMVVIGNLENVDRNLGQIHEEHAGRLRRMVDNAVMGARRAATLTQKLLAYSRRQPLVPKPLDVNKFITSEIDFLQRSLGETIEIEPACGAGLWRTELDAGQLESAILNLAVNARDAMQGGGKLTIETANAYLDEEYARDHPEIIPGQYVMIAVTDSGTGMSKETIEKAFEPFYSTKAVGEGTGLGLSQVYGFVRQSGGHIKIYSEVGQGTTIKLYFPRLLGGAPDEPAITTQKQTTERGTTVVLVEDEELVRMYLMDVLSDLNYHVIDFDNAEDALKLVEDVEQRIDLMLTDVVLPGMNGRELGNKAHAVRPDLKVLYMTGYSRNAIVHQGRLDPGVEMVQKPITQADLAAKIRSMLAGKAG